MYVQVFEEEVCYYYVYECLFQEEYLEGGGMIIFVIIYIMKYMKFG